MANQLYCPTCGESDRFRTTTTRLFYESLIDERGAITRLGSPQDIPIQLGVQPVFCAVCEGEARLIEVDEEGIPHKRPRPAWGLNPLDGLEEDG